MLSLTQRQSLQQRLTPQQVQYLKMLQLPVIALEQRIKQELEANPLLEESLVAELELEGEIDSELSQDTLEYADSDGGDTDQAESSRDDEIDWDELMPPEDYEGYKSSTSTGSETEFSEGTVLPSEETLAETLMAQLRMHPLTEDQFALAEEIIGNIDDDGYLRRDLEEIVDDLNKYIATTSAIAPGSTHAINGDGHFDPYGESMTDEPFGRDRIMAHRTSDAMLDVQAADDTSNGDATDEIDDETLEPEEKPHTLSLQEMSQLSIEDLAKILEQGTASRATPQEAPAQPQKPDEIVVQELEAEPVEPFFSYKEANDLLLLIQRLDPPGIGARTLQECLLIQLEVRQGESPAHDLAYRVLRDTYTEFTMKHFERICDKLGCAIDELKGTMDVIRALNPKPGEGSSPMFNNNYVTPDFVIERDGEDFMIIPNDRNIPTLRINKGYREMLKRKKSHPNNIDRTTRKFLREKFESAKWFIASIQQRRQTLIRVVRAIVELQRDFFLHGPDRIRPMIYKDIAEQIEMDISTVSRVVNGKYMQTDYGIFELRYFFSEKLETSSGEEVSTKIVKARIHEMIDAEDKRKPLSDDALCTAMNKLGFNIARRTVAKYREQMNIPVARLRKTL